MLKVRSGVWLLTIALLGLLATSPQSALAQGDVFIFATRQEPATLDPHIETNNPPMKLFEALYEGLLDYDPDTLEVKPELASSWTVTGDGLVYTFKLRKGVKFHDGTVMDAAAVKYSFERMKAIGLGFAFVLDPVKKIDVVDESTVRITLSQVTPGFLNGIPLVYIVSPKAFKENAKGDDLGRGWAATDEAGTGPYKLREWVKNQQFVLTRFNDYWGGWQRPHVDTYIFRIVPESATQRQLVERGAAHMVDTVEFDDIAALKKNPKVQVLERESLREFYMILNTTKGPLSDVRVRRAVAAVFDPHVLATDVLGGHAVVPRGVIPPKMPGFDQSLPVPKQNLEEAKKLLAEAGYPRGGFTLTYVYYAPYTWQRINGELMQAAFNTMGIDLKIEGLPFTTLTQRMINPDTRPDITVAAVGIPTPDPLDFLHSFFHSSSRLWARNGYTNQEIDRLLDTASRALNKDERFALLKQVQRIVASDVPVIPLTILNDIKVATSNVRGYKFQPMRPAVANWYDLYLEH